MENRHRRLPFPSIHSNPSQFTILKPIQVSLHIEHKSNHLQLSALRQAFPSPVPTLEIQPTIPSSQHIHTSRCTCISPELKAQGPAENRRPSSEHRYTSNLREW